MPLTVPGTQETFSRCLLNEWKKEVAGFLACNGCAGPLCPHSTNTYRAATVSLDAVPGDGNIKVSALMELRVQAVIRWSQKEISPYSTWPVLYRKEMMLEKPS